MASPARHGLQRRPLPSLLYPFSMVWHPPPLCTSTLYSTLYSVQTLYNTTLLNIDQIKLFIENRRKQLNIVFCKQNIRKGEHFKTKTKTSKELYWRSELIINKTVILSLNFSIHPFLSFCCRKTFRF